MRTRWLISLSAVICFSAAGVAACTDQTPPSTEPPQAPAVIRGFAPPPSGDVLVARVIDGDTFVLRDNTRVRVLGIDSCESNTRGGQRAKTEATGLLFNKSVRLRTEPGHDLDRYGRQLRYVTLADGRDLGEVLVAADHTYVYPKKNDASKEYVAKLRSLDSNGRNCNI